MGINIAWDDLIILDPKQCFQPSIGGIDAPAKHDAFAIADTKHKYSVPLTGDEQDVHGPTRMLAKLPLPNAPTPIGRAG